MNEPNRLLALLFGGLLMMAVILVSVNEAKAGDCPNGVCATCPTGKCPLPKVAKVADKAKAKLEAVAQKAAEVVDRTVDRTRQCVKRVCPPRVQGLVKRVLRRVRR